MDVTPNVAPACIPGPESLFEEFGFARDRRIAKWRWVMRLRISA